MRSKIQRNKIIIDASGKILGRLATEVATLLIGKRKIGWQPHIDQGDFVAVKNFSKIKVTGSKLKDKIYYRHSGYPGGLKEETLEYKMKKDPRKVIFLAVRRMLPKNRLAGQMIKRLKVEI